MTWLGKSEMTASRRRARLYAIISFVLGVLSVTLFFFIQGSTPTGWGAPILLIIVPLVLGVTGVVLGVISQRYVWVILNSLVALSFPLFMFFGTLIFGP